MSDREPAFARDAATAAYYEQRAEEYDEWDLAQGRFASLNPPSWHQEVSRLVDLVRRLPPARTLDVACGTGFLTQQLRGITVGLARSRAMLALARSRLPDDMVIVGDALNLPVADGAFDRVLTGHFYGHSTSGRKPPLRACMCASLLNEPSALELVHRGKDPLMHGHAAER